MAVVIVAILFAAAACAVSWISVCGIIKLITLCFGWSFSWAIATGIWLIFFLVKIVFDKVVSVKIEK